MRKADQLSVKPVEKASEELHPFDERNVHPGINQVSLPLFDNGHFAQATFEAFKHVDKVVAEVSNLDESGFKLMMTAFKQENPPIRLNDLTSASEADEQKGFSFLFAGSVMAIRNPRGHEVGVTDTIDQCLDHLCLASLLLRRLDERKGP